MHYSLCMTHSQQLHVVIEYLKRKTQCKHTAFWCPTDYIYIALICTPAFVISNVYACSSEGYVSMILGCT